MSRRPSASVRRFASARAWRVRVEQPAYDPRTPPCLVWKRAPQPVPSLGRQDQLDRSWAGWVYAVVADSGVWKWRLISVQLSDRRQRDAAGGGVTLFGDFGGDLCVLDTEIGRKLGPQDWRRDRRRPYYVFGWTRPKNRRWRPVLRITIPTEVTTGKIVVLGLASGSAQ